MSEYVNSFSINTSEMARLTFSETLPDNVGKEVQVTEPITVSMHIEFLRNVSKVIADTLAQHDETIKQQQTTKAGLN